MQGGFPAAWMRQWLRAGQLRPGMLVGLGRAAPLRRIEELFPGWARGEAFPDAVAQPGAGAAGGGGGGGAVEDLQRVSAMIEWMAAQAARGSEEEEAAAAQAAQLGPGVVEVGQART